MPPVPFMMSPRPQWFLPRKPHQGCFVCHYNKASGPPTVLWVTGNRRLKFSWRSVEVLFCCGRITKILSSIDFFFLSQDLGHISWGSCWVHLCWSSSPGCNQVRLYIIRLHFLPQLVSSSGESTPSLGFLGECSFIEIYVCWSLYILLPHLLWVTSINFWVSAPLFFFSILMASVGGGEERPSHGDLWDPKGQFFFLFCFCFLQGLVQSYPSNFCYLL